MTSRWLLILTLFIHPLSAYSQEAKISRELLVQDVFSQQIDIPKLTGPYLGQKSPGTTPQVFARGIVSTPAHEFSCSFMPDGKEFYFTRRDPARGQNLIMVTKCIDGTWTDPEVVPFIQNRMSFEPRVTPDGSRLYFTWEKPVPGQEGPPMNIWYVERKGEDWSEPIDPGRFLNPNKAMYVSVTLDGTIYTSDISGGPGTEGIAVARLVDGTYGNLERLPAPINVGAQDMYPCIAPDERYLIFASRRQSPPSSSGLFVSFRNPDRTWGEPRAIDLGLPAGLPFVSPDGKYLFFTAGERGKSDIYWVEARFLEESKRTEPSVVEDRPEPPAGLDDDCIKPTPSGGFPALNGPYLGQKGPGPTPEIFAPGILSLGFHEHNIAISPDGKEIFFVTASSDFSRYLIMTTRLINGAWIRPEVAPFSGGQNDGAPSFSRDGKRVYFSSRRPRTAGRTSAEDFDIWYVERKDDSWTDPKNLGGPVNTGQNEANPSVMSDGTIYFQRIEKLGTPGWDLYMSSPRDGVYSDPVKLPAPVNTEANEAGPFIAPDGSYLLFQSNRPGGCGIMDIYVTHRTQSGGWSEPVNLGERVNSAYSDWGPVVSPDGKYLFFGSFRNIHPLVSESPDYLEYMKSRLGTPSPGKGTLYWVEATVIDALKPRDGR